MNRVSWVMAIVLGTAACNSPAPAPAPETAAPPPMATTPHATLAQLMRAIPFPASNIIFDTQTVDPAAPKTGAARTPGGSGGATGTFSSLYGGWEAVENSALTLAETANLLTIPGRMCENGRPAPLDRDDYRKFIQGLADAGTQAYTVAKTRNLEAMVEVSNTVADACAACHEVYRDKDDLKDRCIP